MTRVSQIEDLNACSQECPESEGCMVFVVSLWPGGRIELFTEEGRSRCGSRDQLQGL